MRAIRIEQLGGPEVLRLADVPMPEPAEGQVLVKVAAAGVNYADLGQRDGTYPVSLRLPATLGFEAAGTVAALGPGVAGPAVDTRVVAMLMSGGGYAEFAVADAAAVIPLPDGLEFPEAAAFPIQGLTAYGLLRHAAPFRPGQSVLVYAAAGGVGGWAVQLARLLGAGTVIGAASSDAKLELARRLGADVTVNYTDPGWTERVKDATHGHGADVILDMVGGEIGEQGFDCLAPAGRLVLYGSASGRLTPVSEQHLGQLIFKDQSIVGFRLPALPPEAMAEGTRAVLGYIAEGKVQVVVGQTFPLAEAAEAHRAMAGRKTTGKVVLLP